MKEGDARNNIRGCPRRGFTLRPITKRVQLGIESRLGEAGLVELVVQVKRVLI